MAKKIHSLTDEELKAKYRRLKKKTASKKLLGWYADSYDLFCDLAETLSFRSEGDLPILVALAYSWMPTIPKSWQYPRAAQVETILTNLRSLKSRRKETEPPKDTLIRDLLDELMVSVNRSLVGTSKLLHFVSPNHIPMIDSNVVKAWRRLLYKRDGRGISSKGAEQLGVVKFTASYLAAAKSEEEDDGKSGSAGSVDGRIGPYLDYCRDIRRWARLCGASVRDLELRLFLYGQSL